jgi:hypothetical protein
VRNERNKTTAEYLREDAEQILGGLGELLASSTLRHHQPIQRTRDAVTIWAGPTGEWSELEVEGRRLQSRLLKEYGDFAERIGVLLRGQPEDGVTALEDADTAIRDLLERSNTWHKTTDEAVGAARTAIETQLELVDGLHDEGGGTAIYAADTNAVLYNPDLETWSFNQTSRFEIVLSPTVVVELDERKIDRRNEDLRERAESVIRRVGEYGRRGSILDGVPLNKPTSTIRAIAREPRMDESLSWLDPTNRDDRFIASVLEIMRQHPRSAVTIVTIDQNLKNKADLARIPWVEPPEPAERPARKPRAPRVRITRFRPTGGGEGIVDFAGEVQNLEPHPITVEISAAVGETPVPVHPEDVNLLANTLPTRFRVSVPRPGLGERIPAFNHETTLYDRTLKVVVAADGAEADSAEWSEIVYDPDENRDRYAIQQLYWRVGRGELQQGDERTMARLRMIHDYEERLKRGPEGRSWTT